MKDEIKGKVDELKGKMTGDKSEEMKGKAEQTGDKVRRDARDLKEDLTNGSDADRAERERESEDVTGKRSW
ncbi:MAG TPA: CsbD family protein [Candidatus Dormibacteraeota bacterium]|nr:CsbD family protein [Candidatus Dormibacteraeota bacterium]